MWKKARRFLIYTLCIGVLTLLAGEGLCRVFLADSLSNNSFSRKDLIPRSYLGFGPSPNYSNPLGALPKPRVESEKITVALVGGSAARNLGSKEIQSLLGPKFNFINFSYYASSSRRDLIQIVTEIVSYRPQMIIWYSGYNDYLGSDPRPNVSPLYNVNINNPLLPSNSSLEPIAGLLLKKFVFFQYFFPDWLNSLLYQKSPSLSFYDEFFELRVQALFQNLILMRHYSTSFQASFYAILQPVLAHKKIWAPGEHVELDEKLSTHYPNLLLSHLKRQPLPTFIADWSRLFYNHTNQMFTDPVHNTPEAQTIIRKKLAEFILDNSIKISKKDFPTELGQLAPEDTFYEWLKPK